MAIVQNKALEAQELPPDFKRRVVVKFRSGVKLPYSAEIADEIGRQYGSEWGNLTSAFEGVAFTPYFSTLKEASLRDLMQRSSSLESAASAPDLTLYYAIECPNDVDPESVAKMAAEWPDVEIAYVESLPAPLPGVHPSDDPRNVLQGYLDAAPVGIDARWAWAHGVDGSGVGFVDLERGWMLNHEDLIAKNITIISGISKNDDFWHGTAVLGVVVAVDNTIGGVGIAPACSARVVSEWRTSSLYNPAEAIVSAMMTMSFGDVLLLETSTRYPFPTGPNVPVEVYPAILDVIRMAVGLGIVVIEPAGNESVDLDAFQFNGKNILNRSSVDFQDSGAIMVGAASSAAPHQRLGFSNFGSRIDCYGWGENIDTTGGLLITGTNAYTPNFGGTSGATAIVSGAALLLQSWRVHRGQPRYAPGVLRGLLSDTQQNTASMNPGTDRIGVMPNLRNIIINQRPRWWWLWYLRLTWAWTIMIGGLLITPAGVLCIRCGRTDPGYIGDPVIIVMGAISVVLGVIGLVRTINERNSI